MTTPNSISRHSTDLDTEYKWGFTIDIDAELAPKGLNEEIVRFISYKKNDYGWQFKEDLSFFKGKILNYDILDSKTGKILISKGTKVNV